MIFPRTFDNFWKMSVEELDEVYKKLLIAIEKLNKEKPNGLFLHWEESEDVTTVTGENLKGFIFSVAYNELRFSIMKSEGGKYILEVRYNDTIENVYKQEFFPSEDYMSCLIDAIKMVDDLERKDHEENIFQFVVDDETGGFY